jgi:hypothetical protein
MIPPDDLETLARRVLVDESDDERTSTALIRAVDRAFVKMMTDLSHLVGGDGASALLRRALTQAQRELPLLRGITSDPEGGLLGVEDALAEATPGEIEDAGAAVLAHFIRLLVSLLGPELGLRAARKHWPRTFMARDTDSNEAEK